MRFRLICFGLAAWLCGVLLSAAIVSNALSEEPVSSGECRAETSGGAAFAPIYLTANDLSIATGQPSLVTMADRSAHIPIWSLSGGTVGQSVAGLIPALPKECAGVKVEIVVTTTDPETDAALEDVYRVHLAQLWPDEAFSSRAVLGTPVRTALPLKPFLTRTLTLESFCAVTPNVPLSIRIERMPDDPSDSFTRPVGLALVKVTPLAAPGKSFTVQSEGGYNSWPVLQTLGDKLVCVYSRGSAHTIDEDARAVYARTSADGGKTWTPETVVADTPEGGEVTIGKGLDADGNMLLWVRRIGKEWNHDLYRSADGMTFAHLATPKLDPVPVQITDVFSVPTVGLMALWFAGNYGDNGPGHSWGTLTSADNGATWTQRTIESELPKNEWPTEPSAVFLGDGRILALARTEIGDATTERAQFQMISTDFGATWHRSRTNIGDVLASTPSLIFDAETGLVSCYYYHRGRGILRRRVALPESVWDRPLSWPDSEAVALGSDVSFDAGNVNAVVFGKEHALAFYSGQAPNTAVEVSIVPAPSR